MIGHYASPAGDVTRQKIFKAQRDAKKKAYAEDAPARAARAAEEQVRAEAHAAEKQARAKARAEARAAELQAAAPWARPLDRAEVVPPEAGATTYFVGVYWDIGHRYWTAKYKRGKELKYLHVPGVYPTNQRAARARYDCIRAKDLERFNDMDARDDATDLMVPREKKKRPVPPERKKHGRVPFVVVKGSESRSGRVRKATKR